MQKQMISVAIVDDHPLLRRGLRETLDESQEFQVVAEGASGEDAVDIATAKRPDIMLLDINMPGNGLSALHSIKAKHPKIDVVMLSVYDTLSNVRTAMTGGASGYVLKGVGGDELVTILKAVHGGAKYVVPELAAKLLAQPASGAEEGRESQKDIRFGALTRREKQILELIRKGRPNAEIARKLKLSEATVKHYITPMFRKLGVKNRTEAALL
jgi:DNA-binding NarL/FixJ family response regulator